MARTGRRPGVSGTREAILDAARRAFAEHGYQHAIRMVADLAGVDPALVHHYFRYKQDLFVAAVQLPVNPVEQLTAVLAQDPDQAGERMVEVFLSIWDHAADQSPCWPWSARPSATTGPRPCCASSSPRRSSARSPSGSAAPTPGSGRP